MREKLIELLNNSFDKQYSKRGLLTAPHTADDLIASGVVVSKMETTTDKDTNVPSKPIPHKVENEPIRVGAGLWCKGTTVYRCPKCQTFVKRYCKYCFECGQALEWQTEPPKGE